MGSLCTIFSRPPPVTPHRRDVTDDAPPVTTHLRNVTDGAPLRLHFGT